MIVSVIVTFHTTFTSERSLGKMLATHIAPVLQISVKGCVNG